LPIISVFFEKGIYLNKNPTLKQCELIMQIIGVTEFAEMLHLAKIF
jgi:hypothetical protein